MAFLPITYMSRARLTRSSFPLYQAHPPHQVVRRFYVEVVTRWQLDGWSPSVTAVTYRATLRFDTEELHTIIHLIPTSPYQTRHGGVTKSPDYVTVQATISTFKWPPQTQEQAYIHHLLTSPLFPPVRWHSKAQPLTQALPPFSEEPK